MNARQLIEFVFNDFVKKQRVSWRKSRPNYFKMLAEKSGVTDQAIRGYKHGRNDPSFGNLLAILNAAGYDLKLVKKEVKNETKQKRVA
jgi:transcriptional regulator with XRE-family HTH domain